MKKARSSVSNSIKLRFGRGIGRPTVSVNLHSRDAAARTQEAYRKYRERAAGMWTMWHFVTCMADLCRPKL